MKNQERKVGNNNNGQRILQEGLLEEYQKNVPAQVPSGYICEELNHSQWNRNVSVCLFVA